MTDIIDISVNVRPCVVTHKVKGKLVSKNAIFHKWVSSIVSTTSDTIVQTLALVEYEDGSIGQVKPKSIRFIDNVVSTYFEWLEEEGDENDTEVSVQMS